MALSKEDRDRYLETLKELAKSRRVVTYCVRNLNRAPEASTQGVYVELARISKISHDSINEIMSMVFIALLSRAEIAEEQLGKAEDEIKLLKLKSV